MNRMEAIALLAELTQMLASGGLGPPRLAVELRSLADRIEAGGSENQAGVRGRAASDEGTQSSSNGGPQRAAQVRQRRLVAKRLIAYWRRRCDHPRAKDSQDRVQKVMARLAEGYTERDIQRAIDGAGESKFHQGDNDGARRYDDITLICRTGSRLEQFKDMAGSDEDTSELGEMREQAQRALREGRTDEYERIQKHIRSAASRDGGGRSGDDEAT